MTFRVLYPSSLAILAKNSNLPTIFSTQPTVLVASSIEDEMVLSLVINDLDIRATFTFFE
jgi:hypothetical protein